MVQALISTAASAQEHAPSSIYLTEGVVSQWKDEEQPEEHLIWHFVGPEPSPSATCVERKAEDADSKSRQSGYSFSREEYQSTSSGEMLQAQAERGLGGRIASPGRRVLQHARAHLTGELPNMLRVLEAIALTKSMQCHIPIDSLVVSTFTDVDEGWTELVYEINVSVAASQALAFWDCIGAAVDSWKARLSEQQARLLTEKMAIHVNWR